MLNSASIWNKRITRILQSLITVVWAADEVKKYAEAVTFFDIAIQKKFNIGNAYARKALALDAMKKTDEYVATLEEGLKVDPDNKTMIKNYGLHYLKAGIAAAESRKSWRSRRML